MASIVIGTRGSSLALWQANYIKSLIERKSNDNCKIKVITTRGDRDQLTPLPEVGGKGFFTQEIEYELKNKTIDLAVHSMKDLPVDLGQYFNIGAVPKRFSPFDVMVSSSPISFQNLPKNAIIATGSLRRALQLKVIRKDIKIVDIRGNINTRINKLKSNNWHGLIMAEAAIHRLELNIPYHTFSCSEIVPAAAQGAIAVEVSSSRNDLDEILVLINHQPSFDACNIERKIIDKLDGGCKSPVGCLVSFNNNQIDANAFISDLNGEKFIKVNKSALISKKEELINEIINDFMNKGANELINKNKNIINV
ncbi:MAG: hydroxymethylbilane synthase [Candidatus Marinimicrobia bacterium]|nr:hydroxymethylbilane synthase [Candidatus Neomarinimicrobiota bacterium]|tara:strand:+ start:557 stop:1483 length:927 start_codon:yes stop_codon:yes gene_type:complete